MKRGSFAGSRRQQEAVRDKACIVCTASPCDPAHLIDKSLATDLGDPRAVVPLCRRCHRAYDEGGLDLLPYLEPRWRVELAFAVERVGLLSTLQRVTNDKSWSTLRDAA
jgi:hypothetical protein